MFINELLDRARRVADIPSDNQLAKHLDVSRYAVSMWRNGQRLPDEENVVILAKMAGWDPAQCLLKRTAIKKRRSQKGLATNGDSSITQRMRQLRLPVDKPH